MNLEIRSCMRYYLTYFIFSKIEKKNNAHIKKNDIKFNIQLNIII